MTIPPLMNLLSNIYQPYTFKAQVSASNIYWNSSIFSRATNQQQTMTIKIQLVQLKHQIATNNVSDLFSSYTNCHVILVMNSTLEKLVKMCTSECIKWKSNSQVRQPHPQTGHSFKFEKVKIIHKCRKTYQKCVGELLHSYWAQYHK